MNREIASFPSVTTGEATVLRLGPYAGPFVGLWGHVIGFEDDSLVYVCVTGLPLVGLMASHPAHPRVWTGLLCVVGVVFWFLMSMSYLHQASG